MICRKNFKSEKQFEAHERSKKHGKAVKQLQWEMRSQDKQFHLCETGPTKAMTPLDQGQASPPLEVEVSGSNDTSSPHADEADLNESPIKRVPHDVPKIHDMSTSDTHDHEVRESDDGDEDYAAQDAVEKPVT